METGLNETALGLLEGVEGVGEVESEEGALEGRGVQSGGVEAQTGVLRSKG